MSVQSVAWVRHTTLYLRGVDPALADVFTEAMARAGFPQVSAAEAVEAILADFLAGARPQRTPPTEPLGVEQAVELTVDRWWEEVGSKGGGVTVQDAVADLKKRVVEMMVAVMPNAR